jgi:hypothetical protein
MPTPTVAPLGNFIRAFNGRDQDSPDQGSHRLVPTAAQRILCYWFLGACETMGQVPQCTGTLCNLLTYLRNNAII